MGRGTVLLLLVSLPLAACTEIIDKFPDGLPSDAEDAADGAADADADDGEVDAELPAPDTAPDVDRCVPDPCFVDNRACDDGVCGDCLPGYAEQDGACVLEAATCDPDPCGPLNKVCVNGFCGDCLPGFVDAGNGTCLAQTACFPNPCLKPLETVCKIEEDGLPVCQCDAGAWPDGEGGCTFDACKPDPCAPPFTECVADGPDAACGCPAGEIALGTACVDDPCEPSPCTAYAKSVCTVDAGGAAGCGCLEGFVPDGEACDEGPAMNPTALAPPAGTVTVGFARQLFVDDWLVESRSNLARVVHPTVRFDAGWVVEPTPADPSGIGRARASGSLVHVPEEELAALPADHPLKPYPWRLYYLGYRQLWVPDTQPAWLCVAAAQDPAGPWVAPALVPEEPLAPSCVLRVDGLVLAEVTRKASGWRLSASRIALGTVTEPGLYAYTSPDGVTWTAVASVGPLVAHADAAVAPALYPRIGERSRLVWDPVAGRYLGLFALPSVNFGDARAVAFGQADISQGWQQTPDALSAPAVLGPTTPELTAGRVYGDMAAWRVGDLWLALVQKRQTECPKGAFASLAASRDGRHWLLVKDELAPTTDAIIPTAASEGQPDTSIETLMGGGPAEAGGLWHFFSGGVPRGPCSDGGPAGGGIVRTVVRAGGLVGMKASGGAPSELATRPLRMAAGTAGARLHVDAFVGDKLLVKLEKLSPANTVLGAVQKVVAAGDWRDQPLDLPPLNGLTDGRFRVRFTLTGDGEIFGFRLSDPLCDGAPCAEEPVKTRCDSSSGAAVCACPLPLEDDGEGGCTDDPCVPDPCVGPHELGCTPVGSDDWECGCEPGWIRDDDLCRADPCVPGPDEEPPCPPPGPDRCRAVDGAAECYCPEGSAPGPSGCQETDPRAFVTSVALAAEAVGGLAGADQACQSLAAAAELPGTFGAWLSTAEVAAKDRFAGGGPWRTWDPEVGLFTALVAVDAADLADGTLGAGLDRTEFGVPAPAGCRAWTGTSAEGAAPPGDPLDCGGWASPPEGASGLVGVCGATDASWTAGELAACSASRHLYCLELPPAGGPVGEPVEAR